MGGSCEREERREECSLSPLIVRHRKEGHREREHGEYSEQGESDDPWIEIRVWERGY